MLLLGTLSGESSENTALALPDSSPAVSVLRKLADRLRLLMHTDDVSDAHTVASQTVRPTPLTEVHDKRPRPAPATKSTIDPVDATLTVRVETLIDVPASYDRAADMLPSEAPPVTAATRLDIPALPWLLWHRIDESDCQYVLSLADPPTCRPCEYDASPMPIPATAVTVIPIDPVENALPTTRVLIFDSPSAGKPSVTLPLSKPAVTVTRWLIPITPLLKHLVEESDCHGVASHDVSPVEMPGDFDASPKLDPCIVSITAEFDAAFDPSTDAASVDTISVIVPRCCDPAVIISR